MEDVASLGCSLDSMELSSIEWAQPSGLGCFQFVFKNGVRSPLFVFKDDKGCAFTRKRTDLALPRGAAITEVRGRVLCDKWIN